MLAKEYRLPADVNTKGFLTFLTPLFTLKVGENRESRSRFGFIISNGIEKSAVRRNRVKRQYRRFVEERCSKIITGHDFLFILKRGSVDKKSEEINDSIEKVFKKEGFI